MDSMKSRLITAAVGIPLAIVILILGERFNWIMYFITSLLCILMIFELLSARRLHKNLKLFVPCMAFAMLQPLLLPLELSWFLIYLFIIAMFLIMISSSDKIAYPDLCFALLGTIVIVIGMSSILLLVPAYNNYLTFFYVLCIGVPWCADAGAYFSGVFLGQRKLCPKVSPNKTVEGFLGGILIGTISALIIGLIYTFLYPKVEFNFTLLLFIGLLSSVVSVLGDLSFSLIKRSCKIKDFGSIFPGHGGFLDRFDSVIFSAPLIYFIGINFAIFLF